MAEALPLILLGDLLVIGVPAVGWALILMRTAEYIVELLRERKALTVMEPPQAADRIVLSDLTEQLSDCYF